MKVYNFIFDKMFAASKKNEQITPEIFKEWAVEAVQLFPSPSNLTPQKEVCTEWLVGFDCWLEIIEYSLAMRNQLRVPFVTDNKEKELMREDDHPESLTDDSTDVQQLETTTPTASTTTSDSSEADNSESLSVQTRKTNEKLNKYITFEEKEKVVQVANAHPEYTLEQIKIETGCQQLKNKKQLKQWKKHVESGSSLVDKKTKIEQWVYSKCIENDKDITLQQIKIWFDEAEEKYQLKELNYNASNRWISRFINTHGITI